MRDGWTETTLGDVAEINMGQSPPGDTYNTEGIGMPFMQGSAEFGEHYPTPVKFCSAPAKIAEIGDLLLSVRAPVGDSNFANQRIAIGRGLATVRAKQGADTAFLRLVIQLSTAELLATSGTGMFSSITGKNLREFGVSLPPREEQKRIVDVVSSVDAYIDSLQQQADSARTARNAVLHELLSAGGDNWTETTLGEVALLNPKEPALSTDSPFIPMDAVHVGKRYVRYHEPRGDRSGARANTGDVLFARITPCLENGKVAQIQDGIERCGGSTEFIVIRGTNAFSSDFAYFWATWSDTRNRATGLMTGTTGRQRLSASDLGAMNISLPPKTEQKRIVEIVSSMDDVIQATEKAIADARGLRAGLLADLLSGNHEIPDTYDAILESV